MIFNNSTNLTNGAGLQRDYELLRGILLSAGHTVNGLQFNRYDLRIPTADVAICLEVINPQHLLKGRGQNWFIPNSEWYFPCWNGTLNRFSKFLCKTRDCYNIWSKKVGANKCVYIGFESLDFYDKSIPRTPTFLHMAGKSETKNTAAVMEAWQKYQLPYPLLVAAWKPNIMSLCLGIPNVRHVQRFSEEEVRQEMNKNLFHIMPSKYEGFGHYIHEAIGCGGIVLTTNAAPMNSFNGIHSELLIPVEKREPCREAFFNLVSSKAIADVVHRATTLSPTRIAEMHRISRAAFIADTAAFRLAFEEVIRAI